MKYQPGDEVRLIKPNDVIDGRRYDDPVTLDWVEWAQPMDDDVGDVVTLKDYRSGSGWKVEENRWTWLECWIEPVGAQSNPNTAYDRAMSIL